MTPAQPLQCCALDRFAVQIRMHGLIGRAGWGAAQDLLRDGAELPERHLISRDERRDLQDRAAALTVPEDVLERLLELVARLARGATPEARARLSDRSFAPLALALVRAHAVLRGASEGKGVGLELSTGALLPLAALLLATGLVAGLAAGLLGVGGGIVVVPVLFHVFTELGVDPAVRMHLAVGTSLATIVVTAWRSVASHRARGSVDEALLRSWVAPVLLGVALGSAAAGAASGATLTGVFATVALAVAVHMGFGRESWRLAATLPGGAGRLAIGGGIGFFSVLMGLGGGTLGVPTLTLFGVSIHRAVGTAAGLGLVIAIPGSAVFAASGWSAPDLPPFSIGYVNALGFALIVPATAAAAPYGARLANAASVRVLRRLFAAFLAFTSLRMFWELA